MPNSAVLLPTPYDFKSTAQLQVVTALDAAIMAKTPYAYWKFNEASGAPQDSSGNARHCTVDAAGMLYQQAAITSKAGPSIQIENNRFGLILPQVNLDSISGVFTYIGLFTFAAEVGTSSPAQSQAYGSPFFSQVGSNTANTSPLMMSFATFYASGFAGNSGALMTMRGATTTFGGGASRGMRLNVPLVIAFLGSSIPGIAYTWDIFINGAFAGSGPRPNIGGGGRLVLGRHSDPSLPFSRFRCSNLALFATDLSATDIRDLSQCYMDKTAYGQVWQV